MGPGKYGIFDTFADDNGRNAHLNGEIAKALFAKAKDLFSKPPDVAKPDILAVKSKGKRRQPAPWATHFITRQHFRQSTEEPHFQKLQASIGMLWKNGLSPPGRRPLRSR